MYRCCTFDILAEIKPTVIYQKTVFFTAFSSIPKRYNFQSSVVSCFLHCSSYSEQGVGAIHELLLPEKQGFAIVCVSPEQVNINLKLATLGVSVNVYF